MGVTEFYHVSEYHPKNIFFQSSLEFLEPFFQERF